MQTPLNKIPLVGELGINKLIQTNKIVRKFLLAGDKFIPDMHLRQPRPIEQTKLNETCFQHDMVYDFKDLTRGTISDKMLIKHLLLQKVLNMMNVKKCVVQ